MKKILLFLIMILSLTVFSNIYEVIPQDSKAVIVLNNAKTVYDDLKTVPIFGKILDDPTYAETLITGMIDAYIQSLDLNSDEVYSGFEKNVGIFVIEPQNNNYEFGIVLGPLDDGKKYIEVFSKVIDALMPEDTGINFYYIVKQSELQDYLIITTNKNAYENSKLNFIPKKRYNETGIYEEINTSTLNGYGFSYIKDNYLYSKFNLLTDSQITPKNVNIDSSEFFGLYYSKTTYIPDGSSLNLNKFGINLPEDLINSILSKSDWAEQTGTINLSMNDETGDIESNFAMKIKVKTNSSFDEIEKIIPEDITKEKLDKDYIKISKTVNEKSMIMYIWKKDDFLYISNLNKIELKKYENSSQKLSNNILYKELKSKIPEANIGAFFLDLKPLISFLKDFFGVEGLDGEFGGLGSAIASKTPDGKNIIEFNFIMK
ncbi:hypothetical protein X275_04125 [Marinitoga sp. 1197]|uniref:hypothetical protein n=1 Tax=Marinitoga sp. 1197 TaxID=1428449 RepID=UPI000641324F|nr:hypothetical protein [Marinitoga sp. 1197]KLO23052.1 hypothetical protein X275_04125 [Marinitoga sp. 1197]